MSVRDPLIIEELCFEGQDPTLMARVKDDTGADATKASFTSGNYYIYQLSGTTKTLRNSGTLTINDVMFDALQTDGRWTEDDDGYNFLWTPDAALFDADNEAWYWIEVVLSSATNKCVILYKLYQYDLASAP